MVDDLHVRWDLPSVYLLVEGRLRCQASRGYFQVSDGFTAATGVIGRVVSSGRAEVIHDVTQDPTFIAAIPGLRAEVCVPVIVDGTVVGAVNLESRRTLGTDAIEDAHAAASFLADRVKELGGLPLPSLSERLARIAVGISSQTDSDEVARRAVDGARDLSGMSSAGLARLLPSGWEVSCAIGPLADVMRGWDEDAIAVLGGWVWAGTSSYFPDGEDVPAGYEFLDGGIHALSVQPLVVAGSVTGLLMTADVQPAAHDPALTSALELLASQTAATLAMASTMQRLSHQANHDSLTGLSNRRALVDALQADLASGEESAIVLLDLDGFKAVNDQHGHAAGDALLAAVGRRLSACARQDDLVCRLGGDEFAILVRDVTTAEFAETVGRRFVRAVTTGGETGWHAGVGASAGVRLVVGDSPSSVLVDADAALYAAKDAGRGRTVLWEPRLRQHALEQDALVADLRQALREDALTLVFQPVADIATLEVVGLEALARWHHPVRGNVPPTEFVAAAERAGVVAELTSWLLRTACRQVQYWPAGLRIGLNVSAAQLTDESVVEDVRSALEEGGVAPSRIVLEVTETFAVHDLPRAKETLQRLAALGVRLALDDFGTGYSSLTHAQALPFDILKIDRSFVAAAATGDRGAVATISAVTALAQRLQVDVVAEGVEDLNQLPDLRRMGCAFAQGFALARPLTAVQVEAELAVPGSWILGRPALPIPRNAPAGVPS
ncbi:MAG: Diguanylate cyclase protein [Frankiales bacterium]|nr:Diguanylate cyclase protein [Frankiales bacterium]